MIFILCILKPEGYLESHLDPPSDLISNNTYTDVITSVENY